MPEKFEEKNDENNDESNSSDDNGNSLENDADDSHTSDLLYKAKNGARYKKRKVPRIIRYVRYNKKNDPEITTENGSCFLPDGEMKKKI